MSPDGPASDEPASSDNQGISNAPTSTYRLQLAPGDGFDTVIELVDHLCDLGVGHGYFSPILTSTPGSRHGYDVIDHDTINPELGGIAGLRLAAQVLREAGLGVVVDVVPNHMAIPVPEHLNSVLWDVLKYGPESEHSDWVDVEWAQARSIMLPFLGAPIDVVLDAKELSIDRRDVEPVVRYFDHVFPIRPGTEDADIEELLDQQHYRLAHWRVGDEELDYRRFFNVETLVAVRVEDPAVFESTHRLTLGLVADGTIDGLRIDHPDGLADPRGYLRRLRDATQGAWVVVEKILLDHEVMPPDWPVAGTTGYDALHEIAGLFVDPAGKSALIGAFVELAGGPRDFAEVKEQAKREVVDGDLAAEVERLTTLAHRITSGAVRLRDHTRRGLHEGLVELLVAMQVYRAYVVPGEPVAAESVAAVEAAAATALARLPHRQTDIELLSDLALGRRGRSAFADEFVVRFQQTCGPVMAKGVEDTAFYRWFPLSSLAEVGGEPDRFGVSPQEFHTRAARRALTAPHSMITLTTHDTKRSEDVRARLAVLAEMPLDWMSLVRTWSATAGPLLVPATGDGADGSDLQDERDGAPANNANRHDTLTEYLLWQTIFGAWPIDAERATAYATKAMREAGLVTSWTRPDQAYETAVHAWIRAVLANDELTASIAQAVSNVAPAYVANSLGSKLIAAMMPGIPDVYQGSEVEILTLVDPDNRAPRDVERVRAAYARARHGLASPIGDLDAAKSRVVAASLRLRRVRPGWFGVGAGYAPLTAVGPAADHCVGFARSGALVLATRLSRGLVAAGGFRDTTITFPAGDWVDLLSGNWFEGATGLGVESVLGAWPVALLVDPATAALVWP